jgi:hypothetical protein
MTFETEYDLKELKEELSELFDENARPLSEVYDVDILAYPEDKVWRLKEENGRGFPKIQGGSYLEKPYLEFLEETKVESVRFQEKSFWRGEGDSKKLFMVIYKTHGYHANNQDYKNEDIGKSLFTSQQQCLDHMIPLIDEARKNWIQRDTEEKKRLRADLEAKLAQLI